MLSDRLRDNLSLNEEDPSGEADEVTMIESRSNSSLFIRLTRLPLMRAISPGLLPILSSTVLLPEANSM